MRTFALDLSTVATGWALFQDDNLLKYGVIEPDKDLSQSEKYFFITQSVATLLRIYRPDELSVEDTFYSKDPTVLKKLNRVAGQIMYIWYTLTRKDLHFYMASTARKETGIKGTAKKEEVTEAVNKKFGLRGRVKDHNIADAIVVGYCHWAKGQLRPLPEERRKARRVRPKEKRRCKR